MPAETPIPCSAKVITGRPRRAGRGGSACFSGRVQRRRDRLDRGQLVGTLDLETHGRAHGRGEHHYRHDAAGTRATLADSEHDAALEAAGDLDDARGDARVQTLGVAQAYLANLHRVPPRVMDVPPRRIVNRGIGIDPSCPTRVPSG